MGFFNRIWNAAKSAVANVWRKVIRPAVETVAGWFGIDREKTKRTLDGVENFGRKVAVVLETDVAVLLRRIWNEADIWFDQWLIRVRGPLSAPLIALKRRLNDWLWEPEPPPPMPVRTPPIADPERVTDVRARGDGELR